MLFIEKVERALIKLVNKAYEENEIPIAAVITKGEEIVSKAYNTRNKTNNPLNHAEIICIIEAAKKQKYWRINGYNLYVTLEPCDMCKKIIEEVGIDNVYYFLKRRKKYTTPETLYSYKKMYNDVFETKITMFFQKLRKESK